MLRELITSVPFLQVMVVGLSLAGLASVIASALAYVYVRLLLSEKEELAMKDFLTGAWNSRYLDEALRNEVARSQRDNLEFGLLFIDLDKFKDVNDTCGHDAGDQALRMVSETIESRLRPFDVLARCGGDEFVVLLPEAGTEQSLNVAERIRSKIESMTVAGLAISISAGVATYPADGDNSESLLETADRRLYVAKAQGRNTITNSDGEDSPTDE